MMSKEEVVASEASAKFLSGGCSGFPPRDATLEATRLDEAAARIVRSHALILG